MSNNLGQFNTPKNPAWGRASSSSNIVSQNNQGLNMPQMMNQGLSNMNNTGMLQFQQQHPQVFQSALGIQQQNLGLGLQQMANNAIGASQLASNQIFQQVGTVSYPNPRALNTAAFQTPQNLTPLAQIQSGGNSNSGTKQRVFTGTVTKVHDNFGFVDEDVFFQTNACVKGSNPVVGDRVLVEASFNPSMPFKWNATRIQVLPTSGQNQHQSVRHSSSSSKSYNSSGYNAVPPPESNGNIGNNRSGTNRPKASLGGRGRERSRDRDRDEEDMDRKRRREERQREREKEEKKSPIRRRSRSPKTRRRPRIVPRYMVQIPKIALNFINADVLELRRRYGNMYIPSDFFYSSFEWVNAFPPNKPFSLSKPCFFHIMNKEVEPIVENEAILEPPDADYLFSAKVMLMNVPGMDELYHKCCAMAEDEEKKDRDGEERDYIHPSRLINFLIGLRGKNETMAIGGPWSASLDGPNPDKDPSVLIKTAIRTCKSLTGIDLTNCTQWYRFTELYYRRTESIHKGKNIPARVETVVIYLPDVWSCVPTRLEWDNLLQSYQKQLERELKADLETTDEVQPSDEKDEDQSADDPEPTHHSLLDLKTMLVNDLKKELKARNVSTKGLRSQLVARLGKILKAEEENEDVKEPAEQPEPEVKQEEKKVVEVEEKKLDEKEKALLQKRYTLPDQQHIIVHPSKTAKSGKFDCTVMSLSLLLDYRPEDTKEHSFEVSLFAELFNEMLMRDFGFNIYKALYQLPEKPKEKEEPKKREKEEHKSDDKKKHDDKKRDDDRKKDSDKKKDEDKKKDDDKDKKDDKKSDDGKEKDEKKSDSKKYERKSDNSEDEDDRDEDDKEKKKDKDKKKIRVKLYTKYKHLLLSFVYFDQTHCGYIFDKDIEDLLYTLGLNLSRAQVRKLVGKVITRDSLHYRKLTDRPKDEDPLIRTDEIEDSLLKELATGNKKLLPVFINSDGNKEKSEEGQNYAQIKDDGMVIFQGALIDVSKLLSQLERSDKARIETESRLVNLKNDNSKLNEKYDKTNQSIKRVTSELKEYKDKLRSAEDTLSKTLAYSKLFQTTLTEIRDKIDPVLKSTSINKEETIKKEKDDREKKEKDEGKSRWEKDIKTENMSTDDSEEKIIVNKIFIKFKYCSSCYLRNIAYIG
ncbi:hypothetical protein HHI36_013691 [Cryptolaemus montrouzieri]|uniref:SAP domain-containing protein n=1 Tax=Cryptolaemus montrouzieri TaxID=559131 RepID=A0ABD2NI24_9CUCU